MADIYRVLFGQEEIYNLRDKYVPIHRSILRLIELVECSNSSNIDLDVKKNDIDSILIADLDFSVSDDFIDFYNLSEESYIYENDKVFDDAMSNSLKEEVSLITELNSSDTDNSDISEDSSSLTELNSSDTDNSDISEDSSSLTELNSSDTDNSDISEDFSSLTELNSSDTDNSDISEDSSSLTELNSSDTDNSDISEDFSELDE